jgi:hypothetical protein
MSQSQPVIPVTMQYGNDGNSSYLHNGIHNIEREMHRGSEHLVSDQTRSTQFLNAEIQRGVASLTADVSRTSAQVLADLNSGANADQAQTRSSQIETRQAVERNADKVSFDGNRNSDKASSDANRNADKASLDANRNADYINGNVQATSTAGLLATQNTASDLKSVVTDVRRDLSATLAANFAALGVQSEKNAALISSTVLTQSQAVLLGQKDREVKAAEQFGSVRLQAAEYKGSSDLQASQYKAYLENHITKTAADGLLKTAETTAKIMEKLAECCCENRLAHASTQNVVMQNGTNNQASIQQGQMNQLTQALAAAQQEALVARITNSVINTTTNVGSGSVARA